MTLSTSPKQREVLDWLTLRGALTLEELKGLMGAGHGTTQALMALVQQERVIEDDGMYRRMRR